MGHTVLICPLGGFGQTYPLVGVALALRSHGCEVIFATGPMFGGLLAQYDLERLPYSRTDTTFQLSNWTELPAQADQYRHTLEAIDRVAPDVVIAHFMTPGALLAAQISDVPVAVMGMGAYLYPKVPITMTGPQSPVEARLRESWRRFHHHQDDLHEYIGLPRHGVPVGPETPLLGDRYLLPSVPELAGDTESFPAPVRLVGNCTWDPGRDDEAVADWLAASDPSAPLFYVQHGRTFGHPSFLPTLLEAATGMDVRMTIDAGRLDAAPELVPPNVYLAPHVPAHQVMPLATAAICDGNTTVTMAALAHGLPLLLFPLFNEQFDMARCCAEAGVGIRRSANRVNTAAMRDLVTGLIADHALRERAAVVATRLGTSEAGLTRAASVVQQLAG